MHSSSASRFGGWAAYISAGLSIIGAIALLLFYAIEAPRTISTGDTSAHVFGPISDYAGLAQFLCMLPLTTALHQLAPARYQPLSLAAAALGAIGLLTAALAQTLLVTHVIPFEVNLPFVMVGLVLMGAWMLVASHLAYLGGGFSRRLAWVGKVTGAVFVALDAIVLVAALVYTGNSSATTDFGASIQQNPLLIGAIVVVFIPGLLVYLVGVPVWLFGVGRCLLANIVAPERGGELHAHAHPSL